jgi:hypothetical protein
LPVARLPDDLYVVEHVNEGAHSAAHHRVVVDEEDPYGHG